MALSTLKAYLKKYPHFVVNQPLVAAEVESALRWISYLAAASKYNTSHILSEFLYSSANLIQLLNDHILRKAADLQINANSVVIHLQTLLQVLEYTSVLTEYTANRFASDFGKWIIIGCFQIAKAVIKLILLLKFNQGLQTSSPVIPLDRRLDLICLQRNHNRTSSNSQHLQKSADEEADDESPGPSSSGNTATVTLKRSGRVMRTIDKAPLRNQRTWMLPNSDPRFQQLLDRNRKDAPPTPLTEHQVWAEILHITRPVAHMASIGIFGPASWPPYLISLGMDLTSLKLLHEPHDKIWNMKESIELGQRSFALLLYLLRSPFYDRYTKERILRLLSSAANTIPIFGRLIRPMVSYLPEWQKTYFYVWGS